MEDKYDYIKHPGDSESDAAELAFLRRQVLLLSQRLKESQKHKGSFLSNMRNEIINPFSGILNLSGSLLRAQLNDPEKVRKVISLIFQESFALDFHLKTIFLAADIESGECYPEPVEMRMESVIAQALGDMDHLFRQKNLRLGVCLSFEEGMKADFFKVKMLFLSLLYHMVNKSRRGDGISVKAYMKDEQLYGEIYNSCQIGGESSLFDHARFSELCSFTENIEGIHLSVARSLAEILNGKLAAGVYANDLVAFRFRLPVGEAPAGEGLIEEQEILFS